MAAAESGRREGNQAAVHLHATVGQGVEGGIVGHDSFAVVQHGPGDTEGPHADDRHQQGEHHGLGGGLNDQPTRRRRQRHTGRHRQTAEQAGQSQTVGHRPALPPSERRVGGRMARGATD